MSEENHAHVGLTDRLSFYNIFRQYICHEDGLVNFRMQWMLTIHGFLYATYGFTVQKQLEIMTNVATHRADITAEGIRLVEIPYHQTVYFLYFIALVGFTISIGGLVSVTAAHMSMSTVSRMYRTQNVVKKFKFNAPHHAQPQDVVGLNVKDGYLRYMVENDSESMYLPTLHGGGNRRYLTLGHFVSILIPIILSVSWVLAAANNAITSHHLTITVHHIKSELAANH